MFQSGPEPTISVAYDSCSRAANTAFCSLVNNVGGRVLQRPTNAMGQLCKAEHSAGSATDGPSQYQQFWSSARGCHRATTLAGAARVRLQPETYPEHLRTI